MSHYVKRVVQDGIWFGFYRMLCSACGPQVRGARPGARFLATDTTCSECGKAIKANWTPTVEAK